jgi:hypothetical protein
MAEIEKFLSVPIIERNKWFDYNSFAKVILTDLVICYVI